jgi:signal transduction histidine kinase
MAKDDRPHFDVHPSVVFQLGESLITDAVQALIELVKNCYDADASYAKVTVDTEGKVEIPDAIYRPTRGQIIVEDDGQGMDEETIRSGWFLISSRTKKALKDQRKTTPGGRTPLGDKGLGRLGAQRLAENMEVFTQSNAGEGYHFAFSWLDFATAPSLADVDVHLTKHSLHRAHGTTVVVSDLNDINAWRGQDSLKRLEQELSRLVSPYKAIRDFVVVIEADGKAIELLEISDRVRDLAPVRYALKFDGRVMTIWGRARLDFFCPSTPSGAEEFALIAESDNGKAFFEFLSRDKRARYLNVVRAPGKRWFLEFRREREFAGIDGLESDPRDQSAPADPGPFAGEVDAFDLGTVAFGRQNVFDRINEFRRHIKKLSGIRVYRDGFAIRVDEDWLKLGAQWTSATSYYGLKPDNTLGYVALSARDNMVLEETTDREGFKDTPYYRNFYALLMEFRRFTTEAHEFFGRSWAAFQKARREQMARVDGRKRVEDIAGTIAAGVGKAAQHQKELSRLQKKLEKGLQASSALLDTVGTAEAITSSHRRQLREASESLTSLVREATGMLDQLGAYLAELTRLREVGQVLEDRVDSLRRQMDDMYETTALGLTAEALSHEIFQIADNLARRTKAVESRLIDKGGSDRTIRTFLETVRSSVLALRKQVSFLSPALRYVREQRHDIVVLDFLKDLVDFYSERLQRNGIHIDVSASNGEKLMVRINKGKLAQIVDNFVLNSEYWLKDDLTHGRIKSGHILFKVDRPFVRISDNGRGIDPSVEAGLFEPFVSAKGRGRGRGLGLFIVKQLLDSEGCHVGVMPERNKWGRLYTFQLDLRGALNE